MRWAREDCHGGVWKDGVTEAHTKQRAPNSHSHTATYLGLVIKWQRQQHSNTGRRPKMTSHDAKRDLMLWRGHDCTTRCVHHRTASQARTVARHGIETECERHDAVVAGIQR